MHKIYQLYIYSSFPRHHYSHTTPSNVRYDDNQHEIIETDQERHDLVSPYPRTPNIDDDDNDTEGTYNTDNESVITPAYQSYQPHITNLSFPDTDSISSQRYPSSSSYKYNNINK